MQTTIWRLSGFLVVAGVITTLIPAQARSEDKSDAGVVRISDGTPNTTGANSVQQGKILPVGGHVYAGPVVPEGEVIYGDEVIVDDGFVMEEEHHGGFRGWWHDQSRRYHARNQRASQALNLKGHLHGKFGYFTPTGCCGHGCPLIGHYSRVYAVNPHYFDQRDGQLYGAQGYGVPMAVPLAPNVRHTYNYSWGVPSSRLTPISRVAP